MRLIWVSDMFGDVASNSRLVCEGITMSKTISDLSAVSPLSPALSLRQACRNTGHDNSGKRCSGCPLKKLCESEERWIVRLTDLSQLV